MKTEKLWTLMVSPTRPHLAAESAPAAARPIWAHGTHARAERACLSSPDRKGRVPAANLTFTGQPDTRSGHAMRVSVSSVHRGCGSRAR